MSKMKRLIVTEAAVMEIINAAIKATRDHIGGDTTDANLMWTKPIDILNRRIAEGTAIDISPKDASYIEELIDALKNNSLLS